MKLTPAGRQSRRWTLRSHMQRFVCAIVLFALASAATAPGRGQAYKVTNIVSDGSVPAAVTDSNFINPWGMSNSANWWISSAGTGFNYVIPATTGAIAFKVIVPSGSNPATNGPASGSVATSGATGMLLPNGSIASFLFSTLDGTISGWNGRLGTNNALSQIVINNTAAGAVYTGLALLNTGGASYLLAPNFASGAMEVYDSSFKATKLAGSFLDPNLPSGYVPFGVHVLNNQVWITYAQHTATRPFRTATGAGLGIVDVFDNTGVLISRAVTNDNLNAPWGVAFAPSNFGMFSNDLLIGNFGDGVINVYDPKTFGYLGQLIDSAGKPLAYATLWELLPGGTKISNSAAVSGGDVNTVYFSAGLADEKHGLLGGISNGTVAGGTPTFGFSSSTSAVSAQAGTLSNVGLSIAPVNGFSGTVTLTCSGLPKGARCSVSPAQVNVSAGAVSLASATILTSGPKAEVRGLRRGAVETVLACMMPILSFGMLRRYRQQGIRLLSVSLVLLFTAFVMGCGDSAPLTPAGTSQVTLSATSGTLTQQTTVAYTVQ